MTADAKVGLLLGLFFIVIIAFLVNGLPNFIREENPSTPGAMITTPTGPDMALGNHVPEAVHRLYPPRVQPRETESPQQVVVIEAPSEIPDIPVLPETPIIVENNWPVKNLDTVKPSKRKTHVVKSGENLAVVAQTYYGKDQGNRRVVIQRLYEANTDVLKSPDHIRVGNKLVIPPLDELLNVSKSVVKAPDASKTLFKKFSNLLEQVGDDNSKSVSEYRVREGDSLWSIAQHRLGDGKRYLDIQRLNKDTIKNADDVVVGLRLKLPPQ